MHHKKDTGIPMGAAVVRLLKELRVPLIKSSNEILLDRFEEAYRKVCQDRFDKPAPEHALECNENGNVILPTSLREIYIEICQELDVDPYGGIVGEAL